MARKCDLCGPARKYAIPRCQNPARHLVYLAPDRQEKLRVCTKHFAAMVRESVTLGGYAQALRLLSRALLHLTRAKDRHGRRKLIQDIRKLTAWEGA